MCPATGSSCGPRLAGGDGLARELTREEKKKIRALVIKWCANYDKEYGCLPLECECYMFGKCWTGAYCRYFREAVLPLDPALEAALLTEGPRPEFKPCPICGGAVPTDGRIAYCSESCAGSPVGRKSGNLRGKKGGWWVKNRPPKTPFAAGLPGPVWGVALFFLWLPLGLQKCFPHLPPPLLDTLSRDAGHLRRCYSGGKSRLCNPAHNPV